MKTALVTGAAGFLGSHLCELLISKDFNIIAVDNFCTGHSSNRDILEKYTSRVQFVEADVIQSWTHWESSLQPDFLSALKYVFHFASPASPKHYQRLPLETLWVNSIGLSNCISFANRHKARVIFASTSEVYGDPQIHPQPEGYWGHVNSFGPRACYDEAKRFGEALLYSENKMHGTRHGLVRIFNAYGPRMGLGDGRVVINFIGQALRNEPLTIFGDGSQTRSFCYVSDLVKGVLAYAESNICEPLNIGSNNETTILNLAEMIQKKVSMSESAFIFKHLPTDDPKRRRPDMSKTFELLSPWQPEVSLNQGVGKMIEWVKSSLNQSNELAI